MIISRISRVILAFTTFLLFLLGMAGQASAITLDEIIKRGTVRIGVVSGAPPFGSVDATGKPEGYDIDVANLVAGYLGVKAELIPLVPPARIPALETGKVDFLIATLAPTPARAKTVMFSMPYSAFQMVIMSKNGEKYEALADLSKKRIAVTRGSPQESALVKAALPGTEILRFDDDATVTQSLIAGQADAAAIPDTIAGALMKQRPEANLKIYFTFFKQPNSMTVKLQDFEMRQWLNNTIYFMKVSGELDAISRKWTGSPLGELPVF